MLAVLLSLIVTLIAAALVIYIVGRLNLGLGVRDFTTAIVGALVIAIITAIVSWLLGVLGINLTGILGAIVAIIIAALILMFGARLVPGLTVDGFGGAIIAAIAIGVVSWLLNLLLGLLGIGVATPAAVSWVMRLLA